MGCLQFRLRTVFVLFTLAALALAAVFALPFEEPTYILLTLLTPVPMVFVVCALYGRGYFRTFAIGASLPAAALYFSPYWLQIVFFGLDDIFEADGNPLAARLAVIMGLANSIFFLVSHGLLAMLVRWLIEGAQAGAPRPADESSVPESPFDSKTSAE